VVIKIHSPDATGFIRVRSNFNPDNSPNPNGSVRCDSGRVQWEAAK
jgi:hypothetical protein